MPTVWNGLSLLCRHSACLAVKYSRCTLFTTPKKVHICKKKKDCGSENDLSSACPSLFPSLSAVNPLFFLPRV